MRASGRIPNVRTIQKNFFFFFTEFMKFYTKNQSQGNIQVYLNAQLKDRQLDQIFACKPDSCQTGPKSFPIRSSGPYECRVGYRSKEGKAIFIYL